MAAQAPPRSSTSRRSHESSQNDVDIGSFRRMEEIGRGSFATVYKAIHTKRGGYVAIKSVNMSKLNKKLKDNLFSEIHILKHLHHPHIVSLIDCRESTSHIHLVMEYCPLGDLSYFIKRREALARNEHTADMIKKYPNTTAGGLNEVIVRHFLQQLASALEFLRNKNLIHRDIKPQNLLLIPSPLYYLKARPEIMPFAPTENSNIPVAGIESLPMLKIADFGFARSLPSTSLAETLCGSPLYMAPEILRYEKYDAKADLWSVGTVLYEMMVGKPPFRAANHVELLRKIEKGEDKIRFPEDAILSDEMKRLIRGLLRRHPVERMGFDDFFDNTVVKDEIPCLTGEDRPRKAAEQQSDQQGGAKLMLRQGSNPSEAQGQQNDERTGRRTPTATPSDSTQSQTRVNRTSDPSTQPLKSRRPSNQERPRVPSRRATVDESNPPEVYHDAQERALQGRRPSIVAHATAPARQDLHAVTVTRAPGAVPMQRQPSRNSPSPNVIANISRESTSTVNRERTSRRVENRASRELKEAQERAAQDVAFERDYVVVEKRAVEVNAFADELAASPKIHGNSLTQQNLQRGQIGRRATTQPTPTSTVGANVTPSRAIQIASGRRSDHQRQSSYERRARSSTSTSSAISKAINMASGRLFNFGISAPLNFGKGGVSPPMYSPFPAYPTSQGSLIMIGDGAKTGTPSDEDSKALHVIEDSATRSDVVFGFAEVKYKQLIPIAPSVDQGLGLRQAGIPEHDEGDSVSEEDGGLTVDAIVTLSEEALVLYVKALFLLARSMDIAGAWWAKKGRGEVIGESVPPKTSAGIAQNVVHDHRVNNVVQWVRSRFNEVLEKAEFVRLKLIEAQKRLPSDHPSHPSNHPSISISSTGMATSAENVVVSPGVTAEKLMYLRALEMSRSAAVNELVYEDLPGCEIAYITAIRMLEAVLESDEASMPKKALVVERDSNAAENQGDDFNPVNPDDRESVLKLVQGIRSRLTSLRKKIQVISKRNTTTQTTVAPNKPSATTPPQQHPAVVGTFPR